ncbi:MAG TPA: ATP-binding protein [Gammaproteobacteria bacterium]|nr:ATP-binding protein [Gammaproteobacteria bacterium]
MDQSGSNNNQQLEQAFHVFNEVCQQLEASYRVLENRVAQLNQELAAAHDARVQQLVEKERLANRLGCLLDALPAGVVVLAGDETVQECNPAAEALLQGPLIGRRWSDVVSTRFMRHSQAGQEASLTDGRMVSLSRSSLGTEQGQIILIKDITETRSLEEVANRHKRLTAMGEMAASLAHQIRTPLATAVLYASHLCNKTLAPHDQQGFSERILNSLRYLEHLVSDMLAFAKGGTFRADKVDISALLHELHQSVESELLLHHCTFEIIDETEHAVLRGNRTALLGALQNIVTNAVQACGGDHPPCAHPGRPGAAGFACCLALYARVIETAERHSCAELVVIDRGPGIPEEVLEHIFEPFFTTRRDGTGLGLAVVQAIVHAHEGTVKFESRPGEGTKVTIRLPFNSASAAGLETILTDGVADERDDHRREDDRGRARIRYG